MYLGVECKYMVSRYDTYHMKDITAGNLDSEKEFFVSSVLIGIFRSSCLTVCHKTYFQRGEELESCQILVVWMFKTPLWILKDKNES